MICQRNSERVFDRRLGGKHAYIYELAAMAGQRGGNKQETKTLEAKNSKNVRN